MSMAAAQARALLLPALASIADPVLTVHGFSRTATGLTWSRKVPGGRQQVLVWMERDARVTEVKLHAEYRATFPAVLSQVNDLLEKASCEPADWIIDPDVSKDLRAGRHWWAFHDDATVATVVQWMVDAVVEDALPVLDLVREPAGIVAQVLERMREAGSVAGGQGFLASLVILRDAGDRGTAEEIVGFHRQYWENHRSPVSDRLIPPPPELAIALAFLDDW